MNIQVKSLIKKPYLLVFLNGFMLASLCYFQMERSYEGQLYSAIKQNIDSRMDTDDTQDSLILKTMHTCYTLMNNRANVFGNEDLGGFKAAFIHPTTVDLMTAKGACGAYSVVLAKMLKTAGFDVRIAQMYARGIYAAHNVVEVQTNKGWVVLDATYDTYFTKPDHSLASFEEVGRNWSYFRQQIPPIYDTVYKYEGVRYANWTKIPVVSPALKGILNLCIGKDRADHFSVRVYFLNIYTVWLFALTLIYIPIFLITFRKFIRSSITITRSSKTHIQFETPTR